MNYYNPYFTSYPYASTLGSTAKTGLFSRLFGGINLSSILSGTQKTLNIVNQTIPLVKQAQPIIKNAKTMFKVMNEFKKIDTPVASNNKKVVDNTTTIKNEITSDGPTFFI